MGIRWHRGWQRASGLFFRSSRPEASAKQAAGTVTLSTSNLSLPTKFGATPNLTGVNARSTHGVGR